MSEQQSGAGAAAERVASFLGNAAAKAKLQAELMTLNTVTLPKLHHAVGKHLMSMEKLPPDLEQRRQGIRQLEARNAESVKPVEPPAESSQHGGFAAKAAQMAKGAARSAVKAGGDAARSAQIQGEYIAMGKAAVEKYGEKVVPPADRERFNAVVARREQLLAQQASGAAGRPSGLLRYVGFLVVLVGILGIAALGRSWLAGRDQPRADVVQARDKPTWLDAAEQDAEASKAWARAKTIDERIARQAVAANTSLIFPALTSLSPRVADVLAGCRHDLSFPSLRTISVEVAEALAAHQGGESHTGIGPTDFLGLQGLQELPGGVAAALAAHRGVLVIGTEARPITRLSDEAAKALGKSRSRFLNLYVENVSKAGQDSVAAYAGSLSLPSLTSLDSEALLNRLCDGSGPEVALAVKSLTQYQARCLADSGKDLRLNKVESVSAEVGEILSLSRKGVTLLGLKQAPEAALKMLRANPRVSLP